jgi:hypothetical protein
MREIRHIEKHRQERSKGGAPVPEQYSVGAKDDCFAVEDVQSI